MANTTRFEAAVRRKAYNYGYEQANSVIYSNPDVTLTRQAIHFSRVFTGHADPVYCACVTLYPRKFVTEQLNVTAQKLFSGEALKWVKDGINDAFNDFLGERK